MIQIKNEEQIVPFGKYKGQPVERLLEDESYAQWLSGQDWFQQKFGKINNLIIHNHHATEVETPEHNAMQVKFIAKEYAIKLACLVSGNQLLDCGSRHFNKNIPPLTNRIKSIKYEPEEMFEALINMDGKQLLEMTDVQFEKKSVDVSYEITYGYGNVLEISESLYRSATDLAKIFWYEFCHKVEIRAELKPDIGDDFPAVLRQMRASGSNILIIRNYKGTGATYEEFLAFFKSQNIKVCKESEIDMTEVPAYDQVLAIDDELKAVLEKEVQACKDC